MWPRRTDTFGRVHTAADSRQIELPRPNGNTRRLPAGKGSVSAPASRRERGGGGGAENASPSGRTLLVQGQSKEQLSGNKDHFHRRGVYGTSVLPLLLRRNEVLTASCAPRMNGVKQRSKSTMASVYTHTNIPVFALPCC